MRHGECKTVGSKLVAVTVSVDDDGTAQSCHISGDFFIESVSDAESHALLHDLERALISDDSLRSVLDAHPSCQIIGTDEIAIKTAYSRAVSSNLPPLALHLRLLLLSKRNVHLSDFAILNNHLFD